MRIDQIPMLADNIEVIVGVIGIIVSLVVAYYFYRKSIRVKNPYWGIQSNNLIEGYKSRLSKLQVTYKDEDVENLTISKLIFWNEGTETIDRQDILTANPLRIIAKGEVLLLDTKLLVSNNPSSKFSVSLTKDRSCANINFEYLDHKHGAVIQVVHTGTSSEDINLIGDIKRVKMLVQELLAPKWLAFLRGVYVPKLKPSRRKSFYITIAIAGLIAGVGYVVIGAMILFIPQTNKSVISTQAFNIAFYMATLWMGSFLFAISLSLWRKLTFVSKGLEVFYDRELPEAIDDAEISDK